MADKAPIVTHTVMCKLSKKTRFILNVATKYLINNLKYLGEIHG